MAFARLVLVALLLASAPALASQTNCPASGTQKLELKATRAALRSHQPIRIIAFGSSSTQGSGATAPDRTYPARLEAMLRARWPGADIAVVNRGIGGETIEDMLRRVPADVLAAKPDLVIWQTGANDALHGIEPARFATLLDDGVRRIAATGTDVVLMDNQVAPSLLRMPRKAAYDAAIAHTASQARVSLFSRASLMRTWQQDSAMTGGAMSGGPMIGGDGLHHTDRGYACLAEALGRAIVSGVTHPAVMVSNTPR
jgi:lysophospholipase L1-like esterase